VFLKVVLNNRFSIQQPFLDPEKIRDYAAIKNDVVLLGNKKIM